MNYKKRIKQYFVKERCFDMFINPSDNDKDIIIEKFKILLSNKGLTDFKFNIKSKNKIIVVDILKKIEFIDLSKEFVTNWSLMDTVLLIDIIYLLDPKDKEYFLNKYSYQLCDFRDKALEKIESISVLSSLMNNQNKDVNITLKDKEFRCSIYLPTNSDFSLGKFDIFKCVDIKDGMLGFPIYKDIRVHLSKLTSKLEP